MTLEIKAPAKINWFLSITGRREDGFHLLQTVFQSISLADDIRLSLSSPEAGPPGIRCICRAATRHEGLRGIEKGILNGRNNLAYRAAELFGEALNRKQIPCNPRIQ